MLEQDVKHGGVSLTEAAWPVLRGEETFEGRMRGKAGSNKRAQRSRSTNAGPVEYDAELFERLRVERKALADAKGVPPYVVFSDRSLREISASLPRDPLHRHLWFYLDQ